LFDENTPIHIVHRNNKTYEHSIELDTTNEIIQKYRDTYYKINNFESTLKSMASYKLDELIELCNKLNINIEEYKDGNEKGKKKMTKKDIYNLLVLNY
jgi:NTP pyrophosphatase (non-canonical NTP hydrolase)